MIHENEIAMLMLGLGVCGFTMYYRLQIRKIYAWKYLLASFYILLIGWIATILEEFFWGGILNLLEHVSYAASAFLLLLWCIFVIFNTNKKHDDC